MVAELAQKSLLGKARERPDQVKRVLEKVRQEGLLNTYRQVRERLDEPMALGYSSAGVVLECGDGVEGIQSGDHVASNGAHAGVVSVPKHLCAKIPDGVPLDHAAFTVIGSIAMQGIRLSGLEVGCTAFVIGLGLIGQLTVAILRASGVRVIGTDPDASKCQLALRMGAEVTDPSLSAKQGQSLTGGLGADAVLITASTKSNQPIELAVNAVRKKGRVVLVGVVGLELDRRPWYFKECEFVVSCSYGPGRYDPGYEEGGRDYPASYVRWTEQRNMQAGLGLMASGALDVSPLISHRFPIERAEEAYRLIEDGKEPFLGILLEYPEKVEVNRTIELRPSPGPVDGRIRLGVLGAGNFARMVLLPAISKSRMFEPGVLASARGLSATHTAGKLGFIRATTDEAEVTRSPEVDAVFVITRHCEHSRQAVGALNAGKHVFVEKPLALTAGQLADVEAALVGADPTPLLMVGFNRRFSPAAAIVRDFFKDVMSPITISYRFNAGAIPSEHWTQDPEVGGGRIIGEACHAIDLATFLAGSEPVRVFAESIGGEAPPPVTDDQCFITLRHRNGSISSIAYLAGGDRAYPKERIEVIGGGQVAVIDDFHQVTLVKGGRISKRRLRGQDKGHQAEVEAFAQAITLGGSAPIPWSEIKAVTLASIFAVRSLRIGAAVDLAQEPTGDVEPAGRPSR